MSHILSSENGTILQCVINFVNTDDGLTVKIRCHGLLESEVALERIEYIYKDSKQLFLHLVGLKNTPSDLANRVRHKLQLSPV